MQSHAAVFRDGPSLKEGVDKLNSLYKQMDDLKVYTDKNKTSVPITLN